MRLRLLFMCLSAVSILSCEKEQNRQLLDAYFKYTINGAETVIKDGTGLNNNVFKCTITGDTALVVEVSKLYENVGFRIVADSITDGTYTLSDVNKAYYTNPVDSKRYTTNSTYTGTLTIRKKLFQAKTMLNTVEGQFSFQAADTLTGKTFTLTNGSFLMEREE